MTLKDLTADAICRIEMTVGCRDCDDLPKTKFRAGSPERRWGRSRMLASRFLASPDRTSRHRDIARLPTPDSRLQTPDSRLPTPDSRLQTPDSRLPPYRPKPKKKLKTCVLSVLALATGKAKSSANGAGPMAGMFKRKPKPGATRKLSQLT